MAGWDYNSIAVAKYFFYRYGFQDTFIVPMCTCNIKLSNKENFENKEKSRSRYCISQSTSPAVPVLISALDTRHFVNKTWENMPFDTHLFYFAHNSRAVKR